ncbi:MAG: DNA replication complex GINS family protein, partial [Nanoarchaeota archaeon]|nr:DNA replication complex GINS family protein [Nanoarchaeota archaeon]
MIGYNDLYELLRKEKYSDTLQPLPKKFIEEFKEYVDENSTQDSMENDLFSQKETKSKKQLENAIAIFRELMLKRKRKILNLVFVATETGIMKRDYENMLGVEQEIFESLVKTFEDGDKEISKILNNSQTKTQSENKMIIFTQDVEEFVNHDGTTIGPFKSGELANLNLDIAKILVDGEKANFVDE